METENEARAFCARWLDDDAMSRMELFSSMLREENARQNLVSTRSLDQIWQRHIADSLQLLDFVPRETSPWLDLGSGAGFPGLVLALARPMQGVVLVESRGRRIEWLESVVAAAGLTSCRVAGTKLEEVESFSAGVVTARAFAPLDRLLALSTRFSTPDTVWLLPKGRSAAKELASQPKRVAALFHVEQSRTDPASGILIGRGVPQTS